ncbi:hypothetical protein L1987_33751 [Smallanthus sonchifolius]|uniref:Uncharacterized protein n=1 Tax=Smallanthus sonchifolius TaxID=185202 RepID=A0ACB9HRD9_9ASTR|nr:hypothetical protein L1987_33751 [Smallanthus sonchifolius]
MQGGQSNSQECQSEQGAPKKVRGYTQKAETWKMNSTKRIVVTFNKFGKPVGDEGNELVHYIGKLLRMADHVSIEYSDWRKVPMQKKEDMYSLIKVCLIKLDMYPLINVRELVTRWLNMEFQSTCAVKRSSRSKMKEPHVTGTKSFARLAHEMATKNNGVYPTRGEMYITTRTHKDGSIVDDKAAEVVV